jgi:hypothetical protein
MINGLKKYRTEHGSLPPDAQMTLERLERIVNDPPKQKNPALL